MNNNLNDYIFEMKIKEYDFLERICQTSTGTIYKCFSKKTGQIIAMNILTFFELNELEDVNREIQALKGFRSKYLGQIYECFIHNGKLFLSLEYFPAGSLLDMVVKHTRLSEEHCSVIMIQLLHCLKYFHSQGKPIKNLKPGNVYLAADGSVK